MPVADVLLGLLERGPAHGYTLKKDYDEHFARVKPLPYGQVYASLARFERDGLAEVVGVELAEGPQRRVYALTPTGVARVEDWLTSPFDPTGFAVSTLFTKVTLALLSGRDAGRVLDAQRLEHLRRMRVLTTHRRAATGVELLGLTYELAHLDADLRWIEESGRELTEEP